MVDGDWCSSIASTLINISSQIQGYINVTGERNFRDSKKCLCFKPLANSWVALHPQPKGIIQFVGSFFIFGSLPTLFYNPLLRSLYNQGYTIIAYPCSVIPPIIWRLRRVDHWQASIRLLIAEYALQQELVDYILKQGDEDLLELYLNQSNYFWLGHSLGCKYISILEIISNNWQNIEHHLAQCGFEAEDLDLIEAEIKTLESERIKSDERINRLLSSKGIQTSITRKKSISDQPAILIAPEIYGTRDSSGATIPGLEIFPTGKETLCLIKQTTDYFNLTALIEFERDEISQDDVQALKTELATRPINQPDKLIYQQFSGCDLKIKLLSSLFSHLRPTSNDVKPLASCIAKMLKELTKRANNDYEPQKVKCEDYSVGAEF